MDLKPSLKYQAFVAQGYLFGLERSQNLKPLYWPKWGSEPTTFRG